MQQVLYHHTASFYMLVKLLLFGGSPLKALFIALSLF
jgi:hypothetical protein